MYWWLGFTFDKWEWEVSCLISWVLHMVLITGFMGIHFDQECRGGRYMKMIRRESYVGWWQHVCCEQILYTLAFESIVFLFTLATYPMDNYARRECLLAFFLLFVHCSMLIIIQSWLMLYLHDVRGAIGGMMILHFSAFLSPYSMPGILLPGSWSMMHRSGQYMVEGFCIPLAVGIEIGIITIMILVGGQCLNALGRD